MNAQDHALKQLPAADEPASTSSPPPPSPSPSLSPPRRDPVEDADPSFTRKRPRLDSGSNSLHTMSASSVSPAGATTSPPPELVEMTIRSHPPSSPAPAAGGGVSTIDGTRDEPMLDSDDSPVIMLSAEDDIGSPPVVLIDDDEPTEDERLDAEKYFRRFPYTENGDYHTAVRDLAQYIQGNADIPPSLLPELSQWLEKLPDDPLICLHTLYVDKVVFWDDFAEFVHKILARRYQWMAALRAGQDDNMSRYPFGDQFGDDMAVEDAFYEFFSVYVKLCSRLFLVDVHLLSQQRSEEQYSSPLISLKHMQHLLPIFRAEKSPVFHLLHKQYTTNTREMSIRLHKDFVLSAGPANLLRLTEEIFHQVPYNTRTAVAIYASQILDFLGWFIFSSSRLTVTIDRSEFYRGVLFFFTKYSGDLQNPSQVTDAAVARDLIQSYSTLVGSLCQWDKEIAAHLVDDLMDFRDPESPTTATPAVIEKVSDRNDYLRDPANIPALVTNAWKFRLLRKYIVRGRMELRVMSIVSMDLSLVELYRELGSEDTSNEHPLLQYLADFLLHGRVVDYIISVDSHPQLISRSGNIVGFLVVTHRWVDSQADAIWNTVSNSPDPRVVTATMTMLRTIVHLMAPTDLLYLCLKLHGLPLDNYTVDILRFLHILTQTLFKKALVNDYNTRSINARPWNVCVRMIRDTAPSRESTKHTMDLHNEAGEQLHQLSANVPVEDRHEIYRQCVQHIAERSAAATGSVRVIHILSQAAPSMDIFYFQRNPELSRQILEELPSFVKTEMQGGAHPYQLRALSYRLELLKLLICRLCLDVPASSCNDIWDHVVGEYALSNAARDSAWAQFLEIIRASPNNGFCKTLVSSYVPGLDSQFYTPGLFDFVANYKFPVTRKLLDTEHSEQTLLQIQGGDLLWSFILSAPNGTIEDRAAHKLATRYVEVADRGDVALAEVESAHVALVEQCMQELRSALKAARLTTTDNVSAGSSANFEEMRRENETRFGRILLFQKQLLELVRTKPVFNRARRADSKVETMETETPNGNTIMLKYQCGSVRQSLVMASDQPFADLYQKLCYATGATRINLFAKGKRVNVGEMADQKLSNIDFGGQLLVQKVDEIGITRPVSTPSAGSSVFEATVVKHFDELFAWMDSGDTMSRLLFDFLSLFPARNAVVENVVSSDTSLDSLFPPGKFFQAKYAAQALRAKLEDQLRKSTLDDDFLSNSIRLLDKALLNPELVNNKTFASQGVQLAAVLVDVLLQFLRERPSPDISTKYFSNESLLTDRLMEILSIALKPDGDAAVVQTCYATIVEASLHSRAVWEAFTNHSEVIRLHETLLLVDARASMREHIKLKVMSICGGHLPSTCPLKKSEIVAQYWNTISEILPQAVRYAKQSVQLFDVAEHVFRTNDEYHRNEESLRSYLNRWSTLLLSYRHVETPGGSEVDQVVFGFTKLLRCCVLSLKSFKRPLNATSLMTSISEKLVFVRSSSDSRSLNDENDENISQLPILDTETRKELYDLLLALADDRDTYNALLQLTGEAEKQNSGTLLPISVDRRMEIRSQTGYVGLLNPRAICYMNSLLSQLFMNLNFRQFMLELEVQEAKGSQHLLSETQNLFAEMQTSFRKAADPRPFVACVKNLDKTPIDIGVQMDADEFYNLLFDQWEAQLVKEEHKQKFRAFYGGQTLQQVKSKECEHVSERAETFFALQCDVQGKASLQESLQSFVQGDVMEGDNKYKCESCGGKFVDAVKRTCLKDVPDNLIFHLKRFDFDLNDLSRKKIHEHFEFPDTIDVGLYNIDHLSDPGKPHVEDMFDLVGVVVHFGNCENGHYYSYIRKRPCPEGDATSTWLNFNDADVEPFDSTEIPDRAFGGTSDDGYTRTYKLYSAYMLFYQRRSAIEKDQRQWAVSSQEREPKVAIPRHLEDEINARNTEFIREYCLFDSNHSAFVRKLHAASRTITHGTCSENHEQETHALKIFLTHLSDVVWRHSATKIFDDTLAHLRRATLSCSACCNIVLKWLAADETALFDLLLRCPHQTVRSQTRFFLIECLKFLREKDPVLYGMESMDSDMELDASASLEGVLATVIRRLRSITLESYQSTRGWDDLYLTLTRIVEMGHVETAVLLSEGFLILCLELFSAQMIPAFSSNHPELMRIVEKKRPVFNKLIQFTSVLLSRMDLRLPVVMVIDQQNIDRMASLDREQMRFALTQQERNALFLWSRDLHAVISLDKMLELFDGSKTEKFHPGDILRWMFGSADTGIQRMLFTTINEGIGQAESPLCDAYVRVAIFFCEACPIMNDVKQIISRVGKAAKLLDQGDENECSVSGEAIVHFFAELPTIKNKTLFEKEHPGIFHHECMAQSLAYAVPLLIHSHEYIRRSTHDHLRRLFLDPASESTPSAMAIKYDAVRELLKELTERTVYEANSGTLRSHLDPMMAIGQFLTELLSRLMQSEDSELDEYQSGNDTALIVQWQSEVEHRARMWPDEGTPTSTGEGAFENSDYGSESEEVELIDD